MNIVEIEGKISETEKELVNIIESLEAIRQKYRAALNDYAADWIKVTLERELIIHNPEKAKAMGEVGMTSLKRDFKKIQAGLPKRLKDVIGSNERWPHQIEFRRKHAVVKDRHIDVEHELEDIIRTIVSQIGPILKKYDLIKFGTYSAWKGVGDTIIYQFGFDLSPSLKSISEEYKKQFYEFERVQKNLDELNVKKNEEEARILWNKA